MGPAKLTRFFTYLAVFAAGSLAAASFFSVTNSGFLSQSVEVVEAPTAVSLPPVAISGGSDLMESSQATEAPPASSEPEPLEPSAPEVSSGITAAKPATTETPLAVLSDETSVSSSDFESEPGQAVQTVAEEPRAVSSAEAAVTITPIGEVVRGTRVVVEGVVERVTDEDEFIIADSSGSIMVWTGNSFFTVEPGESVVVSGFVDDDLVIEIYAQRITKSSGEVIEVRGDW